MDTVTLLMVIAALALVAAVFLMLGRRTVAAEVEELIGLRAAKAALDQRVAVAEMVAARAENAEDAARVSAQAAATASEARVRAEAASSAAHDAMAEVRARAVGQAADMAALRKRLDEMTERSAELGNKLGEEAGKAAGLMRALQEAQTALVQARAEADQHRSAVETLRAEMATQAETLAQERLQSAEKLALLREVGEDMQAKFKTIADQVIAQHGDALAKKNIEQLDGSLNPLRLKLIEFQTGLQAAHAESEKERARLGEQIKTLSETSARMSTETHNLTRALKGKSQTQGAWGEMILSSILEKSGLRQGEEYEIQQSHSTDEGERLRPDVIVRLPGDQRMVIDAKVSLTAYEAATAAETEEERALQTAAHARSVRQHIRTLGGKEYQKHTPGSFDYVVMFMPIEGALAAALQYDADLVGYAIQNSVFIATPTTLMIALRTAANVWNVERRNRNAEDIAARAGSIYDKMVGFTESMERLDKALGGARDQFDKAMGQLSRGKGNALRQLEQLKAMGAKTGKSLPAGMLDDAAGDGMADLLEDAAE